MGVMNDLLTNDLFPQATLPVTLQGQIDLEGFRRAARGLLAQNILPGQVSWHCSTTPAEGLPSAGTAQGPAPSDAPAVAVPPEFLALCQAVILHSNPQRFSLLYRLLWRLVHEPELRHNQLDADVALARQMAEEVRHDMQKMKAQLRFHSVQDDLFKTRPQGGPLHVAWFEPEHHIVEAVAPLFGRRFAHMRWAILTPQCSVEADYLGPQNARHAVQADAGLAAVQPHEALAALRFRRGADKGTAPSADASEQRWLTFYEQVFHPDRLRRRMMQKEQPRHSRKSRPRATPGAPAGARKSHAGRGPGAAGTSGASQAPNHSLSL
ncbi:TIGR03915 family putative DNA repair protein [Polaromonas aquatica]|uniref:TIGR03915 family putative DNA repair protein n=1 Tax=Polaromonas aquatica TaxID=332657 RepID=UPI003D65DBDE